MGCSSSSEVDAVYNVQYLRGPLKQEFDSLRLSEDDVYALFKVFKKIDVDESGRIGLIEFFHAIRAEQTKFTDRVFSIFDRDGSGGIDFREFVLLSWNYLSVSDASLALFAFDLYDSDSSGILSLDNIHSMLTDMYGKIMGSTQAAYNEIKQMHVKITPSVFLEFTKTHHSLLFPAFRMQLALRQKILGEKFWTEMAKRRVEISSGHFVTVTDLMKMALLERKHTTAGGPTGARRHSRDGIARGDNDNSNSSNYRNNDNDVSGGGDGSGPTYVVHSVGSGGSSSSRRSSRDSHSHTDNKSIRPELDESTTSSSRSAASNTGGTSSRSRRKSFDGAPVRPLSSDKVLKQASSTHGNSISITSADNSRSQAHSGAFTTAGGIGYRADDDSSVRLRSISRDSDGGGGSNEGGSNGGGGGGGNSSGRIPAGQRRGSFGDANELNDLRRRENERYQRSIGQQQQQQQQLPNDSARRSSRGKTAGGVGSGEDFSLDNTNTSIASGGKKSVPTRPDRYINTNRRHTFDAPPLASSGIASKTTSASGRGSTSTRVSAVNEGRSGGDSLSVSSNKINTPVFDLMMTQQMKENHHGTMKEDAPFGPVFGSSARAQNRNAKSKKSKASEAFDSSSTAIGSTNKQQQSQFNVNTVLEVVGSGDADSSNKLLTPNRERAKPGNSAKAKGFGGGGGGGGGDTGTSSRRGSGTRQVLVDGGQQDGGGRVATSSTAAVLPSHHGSSRRDRYSF